MINGLIEPRGGGERVASSRLGVVVLVVVNSNKVMSRNEMIMIFFWKDLSTVSKILRVGLGRLLIQFILLQRFITFTCHSLPQLSHFHTHNFFLSIMSWSNG